MAAKRILFINPAKKVGYYSKRIHMGFSLMGRILGDAGFSVKLLDYSYLKSIQGKVNIPSLESVVSEFKPDLVGVSVFTYVYDEAMETIHRLSKCTDAPIIVGGPHVTLFPQDFSDDSRVSYVVRGEAEEVILDLAKRAVREPRPVVINPAITQAEHIPEADLDIALGCEYLTEYQIQLSRGCPFHCSFCTIDNVAGRKVRGRDIDQCLSHIFAAKKKYPSINTVTITDDCPTYNKKRFKEFLSKFAQMNTDMVLSIDNVRADLVDEEMIRLFVEAGGQSICLGVESGHPEVFKHVNKGETQDDIRAAARLIRKYKLLLGMCFVIGLPEDNLERHKSSISFAKEHRADFIFWNMCTPWPGTAIHKWFLENGSIGDIRNFSTLIDLGIVYGNPPAISRDFPKEDRIKAWLMANLETANLPVASADWVGSMLSMPATLMKLLRLTIKYSLYSSLGVFVWRFLTVRLPYEVKRIIYRHYRKITA